MLVKNAHERYQERRNWPTRDPYPELQLALTRSIDR